MVKWWEAYYQWKPKRPVLAALIIIVFLGILYNYKALSRFPYNIHAWTSADRYALSQGFLNNGLNFFKPETFVYNQQYPENAQVSSKESITAVDFPIHDFIPAIFMKLFGFKTPIIFRLYILIYSMIGMMYLFKLSLFWSKSFYKSLFITVFAATSPVFAYYSGGFLPTIPSLANAIIGLYFYSKYFHNQVLTNFYLSIFFFTLAALARTTFLIPLIAVLGFDLLLIIRRETVFKAKILSVLTSIALIIGYFLYNGYLREKYGSIFLSNFLPAKDLSEAKSILVQAHDLWGKHYFNINHYVIFYVLIAALMISHIAGKIIRISKLSGFTLLTFIIFIGNIFFAILMMQQLRYHDYYFLDSFFLPCLCLMIILIAQIDLPVSNKYNKLIVAVIYLIAFIFMINKTGIVQRNRLKIHKEDNITQTVYNYSGGKQYLDSLKIPENAKILVLDGTSPNIALARLDRKGFSLMFPTRARIKEALTWDFDYIVFENDNFEDAIYNYYPEILSYINKINDNGKISLYKWKDKPVDETVDEFLRIEGKEPVFIALMTFDSSYSNEWYNIKITSENSYSGKNSGLVDKDSRSSITFESHNLPQLLDSKRKLYFSGYFLHHKLKNCLLVINLEDNGQRLYYKAFDISDSLKFENKWERIDLQLDLPQIKSKDYQLSVYLYNTGKNEFLVDNFGFQLY